ncbi:MAG: aspartoacylase [Bdellovibrionaceae bacterium]|nr:aspartoacylase [Pseudobdellovibrionaceae bacterium]
MKVVLVGGTHGNEKTGVYLIKKWLATQGKGLPADHEYLFLLANPRATEENRRFIDSDLNRSFGHRTQAQAHDYEFSRARELTEQVQNWSDSEPYFLIDLHTTTSNMGVTFVLSRMDGLSARVVQSASLNTENSRILMNADLDGDCVFVESIAPHGIIIEVGPVAQNVYDSRRIELTEMAVHRVLQALADMESDKERQPPAELDLYQEKRIIRFPQVPHEHPPCVIHPDLVGGDYSVLRNGMPVFIQSDGEVICWQEEEIYPVFINEAAYLPQQVAFMATRKVKVAFP